MMLEPHHSSDPLDGSDTYIIHLMFASVADATIRLARVRGLEDRLASRIDDMGRSIADMVRDCLSRHNFDGMDDDAILTNVYQEGLDAACRIVAALGGSGEVS